MKPHLATRLLLQRSEAAVAEVDSQVALLAAIEPDLSDGWPRSEAMKHAPALGWALRAERQRLEREAAELANGG